MKLPVSDFSTVIRIEKNTISILNSGGKNLKQTSFITLFFKLHFFIVSFFSTFQNFKKNILFIRIFSLFFNSYLNKVKAIDKSIFYNIKKLLNYKKNNIVLNLKKLILRRFSPTFKTKKFFFIEEKTQKQNKTSFLTKKIFNYLLYSFKIQNIKKYVKSKTLIKNKAFQSKIKMVASFTLSRQHKNLHTTHISKKQLSEKAIKLLMLTLIKIAYKKIYLIVKNEIIAKYNLINLKHYLKNKNDFFFKHRSKIILYNIKWTSVYPLLSFQIQLAKKNSLQKIKKTIWSKKMTGFIQKSTKRTYQIFNKTHYNKLILNWFYKILKKFTPFLTKIKSNNQFKTQHNRSKQTKLNSRKENQNDRNIYGYCCS